MSTSENIEAAFIARITASTTHEIRNVLAIVKESAGLVGDMVQVFEKRGRLDGEKLARAIRRIDAQVGRGAEIITNLNRFAHSLDHHQAELDVVQEAQQVAFLCQRFARQGRHTVQVEPASEDIFVVANSLRLQMALFTGVECCLEQVPEGTGLKLRVTRNGDGVVIEYTYEGTIQTDLPDPADSRSWERLREILDMLAATAETTDADCGLRIVLPAAAPH
jgi:C4-dicarboxylate-specific signal transduction histidine kinase